ncbi:UDP-N-acetylmuramoyl-tripeptide--D-alanyl-D-alanine ligase [Candidatus Sumerlaeota bacterium]|nr:UDP-N-acetylmuramoyl-tripeptide--D-alanyl-D-alanine ligase [Candidatus Sumerlaeota bacterium]
MDWPIREWIEAVKGRLVAGSLETRIQGVSTDSRTISPGQAFVALKGPKFDGHDFCGEAINRGAIALIVADPSVPLRDLSVPVGAPSGVAVIAVEDTLKALGRLAATYRGGFSPMVGALSGSSGKTTAKDILRLMIEPTGGLVTHGNLNNLIGVPLMVFRLEPSHKTAVFELAMNQPGELAELTEIVRPEIVALTNIGSAHRGNFPSHEALRAAKAELIVHSPPDAIAVLNADCYDCALVAQEYCTGRDIATFGIQAPAHFRAEQIEPVSPVGYRFDLVHPEGRQTVTLSAFGGYNIYNVLCAAAIGYLLEAPLDDIYAGIEAFRPASLRSEVIQLGRVTVIADCYNANPESVEAAIDGLAEFAGSRRCVFVFADMLEQGDDAEMAHRMVGQTVAERRIDLFATTGDLAAWASWEAGRMGVRSGHFETKEALAQALLPEIRPGDVVLVKGSRLMALEDVIERLRESL